MLFIRFVVFFSLFFAMSTLQAQKIGNYEPKIAYDSVNDEYLMVYQHVSRAYDYMNDKYIYYYNIRGQKLDAQGNPIGIAYDIDNAVDMTSIRGNPDVYCPDSPGYCLVVWEDSRDQSSTIYGRFIPNSIGLIGNDFPISDSAGANRNHPAVAFGNDYYMVVWDEEKSNSFQAHSNIFKYNQPIPPAQIVHDDTGTFSQPDIEYDPDSKNFITVFVKMRNTFYEDILAFIHPASSNAVALMYYNITDSNSTRRDPTLAYNTDKKEMLIAFKDVYGEHKIGLQRFGNIATFPGNVGAAFDSGPIINSGHPSLSWNEKRKQYLLTVITTPFSVTYDCRGVLISGEWNVGSPFLLKKDAKSTSLSRSHDGWMLVSELFSDLLVSPELEVFKWPQSISPALIMFLLNRSLKP